MPRIEFHTPASTFEAIPHPFPAGRHLPDWFKNMPPTFDQGGTVKRCPPFLAAMTAGYIIPLPADVRFSMSSTGQLSATCKLNLFGRHVPEQFQGSPFAPLIVVKFRNPWIVVTPPEYVCLISAPLNRFEMPFLPLTGIVETGTYYKEVQLPVACTMRPGQIVELRRGTPLIQVIPIRREEWTGQWGVLDESRRAAQQAGFDVNPHEYKEKYWKKLEFT